jgi:hypothetical protein
MVRVAPSIDSGVWRISFLVTSPARSEKATAWVPLFGLKASNRVKGETSSYGNDSESVGFYADGQVFFGRESVLTLDGWTDGCRISAEVDMNTHTLIFLVDDVVQKLVVTNVPLSVQFGVC